MVVCVKQVPDTTEIRIDPVKNTLIRDGVASILNPFDGYALEAAARIKDQHPDSTITVICMGPNQAKEVLKESLAIAADKAYLISDRKFGGSDTFCTSYILSEAIKEIEKTEGKFDIIFCGKQAIDGDTAQVGPEIAEHLGYPQVTYGLEAFVEGDMIKVKREIDEGIAVVGVKAPCVLTFTKPVFDPRLPTIRRKLLANKIDIPVLGFENIPDINPDKIGLKHSPTRVKKTFVPQRKTRGIKIQEKTEEASAKKLFATLSEAHVI